MNGSVPNSARDPETPPEVVIRMTPREPDDDPTFGVPVAPKVNGRPRHRLVTIGDSLTAGFQSGAVFNTSLSWPMIVAWEMGWDDHLRHPTYNGFGGLPINIEYVLRHLEERFGDTINWWELGLAAFALRDKMADIEDFWERGPGSHVPPVGGIMHNLAVWGWDVRDALSRNAKNLVEMIKKPRNNYLNQVVENSQERTALRVYESARSATGKALTSFEAAAALGAEGALDDDGNELPDGDGIETLVVMLGANNALGAMVGLRVIWSADGYDDLLKKEEAGYTIWNPKHFESEFTEIVERVKKIRARHVIFGNVPHVTIAPIARGVHQKVRPDSRYFPFYTRPWISDRDFNANDDPNITEQQARAIDSAIDQYNDTIADTVKKARGQKLDWYLLDVAGILDRLAARRYMDSPLARPAWWTPYELPPEMAALSPVPDSRFFSSGPQGRLQGGLFSLDGVHPTTVGYGIVAQEVINVMQRARVEFYFGDETTKRTGPVRVDFKRLIALDTLISDPPRSIQSDLRLLGWMDQHLGVFKRIFSRA